MKHGRSERAEAASVEILLSRTRSGWRIRRRIGAGYVSASTARGPSALLVLWLVRGRPANVVPVIHSNRPAKGQAGEVGRDGMRTRPSESNKVGVFQRNVSQSTPVTEVPLAQNHRAGRTRRFWHGHESQAGDLGAHLAAIAIAKSLRF
jgi:hypothetical protein